MTEQFFVITGSDEGIEIEPYYVEGLDTAVSECEAFGDESRYREGFNYEYQAQAKVTQLLSKNGGNL